MMLQPSNQRSQNIYLNNHNGTTFCLELNNLIFNDIHLERVDECSE